MSTHLVALECPGNIGCDTRYWCAYRFVWYAVISNNSSVKKRFMNVVMSESFIYMNKLWLTDSLVDWLKVYINRVSQLGLTGGGAFCHFDKDQQGDHPSLPLGRNLICISQTYYWYGFRFRSFQCFHHPMVYGPCNHIGLQNLIFTCQLIWKIRLFMIEYWLFNKIEISCQHFVSLSQLIFC